MTFAVSLPAKQAAKTYVPNAAARTKLSEARIVARRQLPYLTFQILSLTPIERPGLGTMAVDKYLRLYYDPEFVLRTELDDLAFIVAHEALHPLYMHCDRAPKLLGPSPAKEVHRSWAIATDLAVNDTLITSGLSCPKEGQKPKDYKFPSNLAAEQYFDLVTEKNKQQPQPPVGDGDEDWEECDEDGGEQPNGKGRPGKKPCKKNGKRKKGKTSSEGKDGDSGDEEGEGDQGEEEDGDQGGGGGMEPGEEYTGEKPDRSQGDGGSGCDGIDKPWECGPPSETAPGMKEFEQEMLREAVAKAIEEHQRTRGSVPGNLLRMAKQILRPTVDPVRVLESLARYCVTTVPGFGRWTYRKASRRNPPEGTILPANVKPLPRVVILADTSGSMNERDLGLSLGVVDRVLKGFITSGDVTVYAADTRIATVSKVFRADQIKLGGGGGTDMAEALEEINKTRPLPQVVIVCTDGETGWPTAPMPFHVLACLTRNNHCYPVPSWIHKVYLKPNDE